MQAQEDKQSRQYRIEPLLSRLGNHRFRVYVDHTYRNGVEMPGKLVELAHTPTRGQLIKQASPRTSMKDVVRGPVYSELAVNILSAENIASIDAKLQEAKERSLRYEELVCGTQITESAAIHYAQSAIQRLYTVYEVLAREEPIKHTANRNDQSIAINHTAEFTSHLEQLLEVSPRAAEKGYARLMQARELARENHFESAVVLAQTATQVALQEFLVENNVLDKTEARKGYYTRDGEQYKISISACIGKLFDEAVVHANGYDSGNTFLPKGLRNVLVGSHMPAKPMNELRNSLVHQGEEVRNPYLVGVILEVAKETIALCANKGRTEGAAMPYYTWLKDTYIAIQQRKEMPKRPPHTPALLQSAKYATWEELLVYIGENKIPATCKAATARRKRNTLHATVYS